jgi:hypothetical protein
LIISGFFVPVFSTLFVLWLTVSDHFKPESFRAESKGTNPVVRFSAQASVMTTGVPSFT